MSVVLGRSVERSHYELEHRFRRINMPTHPSTIRLTAYWQECESRGGLRMGRDIPARAIARFLQDITVAEPVRDWADARIRLAGSAMAEYFGRDVSGELMSEILADAPRDCEMMLAGAKAAVARNRPGSIEQVLLDNGHQVLRQELTAFPITAPDGEARWTLTSTFSF